MPALIIKHQSQMVNIRHTTGEDIDVVMSMFEHSRKEMRQGGNFKQWIGYPNNDDVKEDIRRGISYIIEVDGAPQATFALLEEPEPTYAYIDHGRWLDTSTPYATLHRLAKSGSSNGMASIAFNYAKDKTSHLRVDTHADNHAMRHILEREGFVYCGIVYMPDGGERLAYEWWRWDEVRDDLQQYIEHHVMPLYDHFDAAHGRTHARRVIARTMILWREYGNNDSRLAAIAYTAAAMHDIGLIAGRENHHTESGRIIRNTDSLQHFFTAEEIEAIAIAAEDHRASSKQPPRTIVGYWVAEADRDVEPHSVVKRTVQYGKDHYPQLTEEEHWQRAVEHLTEKYSAKGYLSLLLENSPNKAPLEELRRLISDRERLKEMFDFYFNKV